jgi:hypothetical protein
MAPRRHYGGSFAPPLPAAKLKEYAALARSAPPPVKDAVLKLCEMVEIFQETPKSKKRGTPHPAGKGFIVPLEEDEVKRIWDHVPWDGQVFDADGNELPKGSPVPEGGHKAPDEREMLAALFNSLPTGLGEPVLVEFQTPGGVTARRREAPVVDPAAKALRDAAFHLLWHAVELSQDREPITTDQL